MFLRSIQFFRRGGGPEEALWAWMSNLPALPLYLVLKNVTLPQEAVKFIVTHLFVVSNLYWPPFLGRQKIYDPPLNSSGPPPSKNWMVPKLVIKHPSSGSL